MFNAQIAAHESKHVFLMKRINNHEQDSSILRDKALQIDIERS